MPNGPEGTSRPTSPDTHLAQAGVYPSALSIVGAVASQAVLFTALLYYFGWAYSRAYYGHFGVDLSIVEYDTRDYVLRSVSATFWPAVRTLLVIIVLLSMHRVLVLPFLDGEPSPRLQLRRQVAMAAVYGAGIALLVVVITGLIFPSVGGPVDIYIPLMLIAGVALLGYAGLLQSMYRIQLTRTLPTARKDLSPLPQILVLLGLGFLGCFWAVGLYGDHRGHDDATNSAAHLAAHTSVVVFSVDKLAIEGTGQAEAALPAGGKYGYMYSGLLLLTRTPDAYLLLPQQWQQRRDRVFLVPEGDDIRIDIAVNP